MHNLLGIECLDCVMAVLRIAAALALIYHLAGARHFNLSILKQKVTSTSNDLEVKSSHKYATCPLWKYHKYHNSSCECGSGIDNVVDCKDNQSTISIVSCYCMSYSDKGDGVVVGACLYSSVETTFMWILAVTTT